MSPWTRPRRQNERRTSRPCFCAITPASPGGGQKTPIRKAACGATVTVVPMRRTICRMNEIQRLIYLDAMGIDSYVSRRQLPLAAPSKRLRIVRPAASPRAADQPGATPPAARSATGRKARPAAGRAAREPVAAAADAVIPVGAARSKDVPVFAVAAASVGGWYWLDEFPPGRALGAGYMQLLQAICFALGRDADGAQLEQFHWPLPDSGQLEQDAAAARAGFTGFLQSRLERLQPQGVVLLGGLAVPWFDRSLLEGYRTVSTVSAWEMLRQPQHKRQAWADLQPLRDSA